MNSRRIVLGLIVTLVSCDDLSAISVQVLGSSGSDVAEIVRDAGDTTSFSMTLQLFNESSSNSAILALWQLDLSIIGDNDATGNLEMVGVAPPAIPFFDGPGPAVTPPTTLPSETALIQDADVPAPMMLPGKALSATEARSIVDLNMAGSSNAAGVFYLVLGSYDPISGSAWYDGFANPSAFANAPDSVLPGRIVLARISFLVPEPSFLALFVVSVIVGFFPVSRGSSLGVYSCMLDKSRVC